MDGRTPRTYLDVDVQTRPRGSRVTGRQIRRFPVDESQQTLASKSTSQVTGWTGIGVVCHRRREVTHAPARETQRNARFVLVVAEVIVCVVLFLVKGWDGVSLASTLASSMGFIFFGFHFVFARVKASQSTPR